MGRMFRSPSGKRLDKSAASTVSEPATEPAIKPRKASPASRFASLSALWTGPLAKNAARTRPTQTERNTHSPVSPANTRAARRKFPRHRAIFHLAPAKTNIFVRARRVQKAPGMRSYALREGAPKTGAKRLFLLPPRLTIECGAKSARLRQSGGYAVLSHWPSLFRREGASEIAEH